MPDVAYLDLADDLERDLMRSDPGTRLPSELQLAADLGVSRITTRAALQELERRHFVVRRRGAGTFVALRIDYPVSADTPPSFSETIRRAGHRPGTKMLDVATVRAPAAVREGLALGAGARVVRLRRCSSVDGHEAGLHTSWLTNVDAALIRDRLTGDGTGHDASLFALLAETGFDMHRESYTAEQATIPADVGAALGLEGRPQAWHTFSRNRCHRTGLLVEMNESWVRADVIRVRFELGATRTVHPPAETENEETDRP